MEENNQKKQRGGARTGAGRKRTVIKTYMVYATQEVHDILQTVKGSRSDFICKCILEHAAKSGKEELG